VTKRAIADPEVEEPQANDGSAEFEVDGHGTESGHVDPVTPEDVDPEVAAGVSVIMGWTPQEASQLICAMWNLGILIYGPEWAAHPSETSGWDISAAQLLDQFLPKGTGGMVELGAGLFMVGNGLAMMAVNRIPIIKRGPRPLWVKKEPVEQAPGGPPPAPAPRPAENGTGGYKLPRDLAPAPAPDLNL